MCGSGVLGALLHMLMLTFESPAGIHLKALQLLY